MTYRRRASALHAARASAAIAWLTALGVVALVQSSPLVLGAVTLAVVLAGVRVGVGRQLLGLGRYAVGLGLAVCLINALVTRDGLTVIWRFGDLPVIGQTNVTLEATVYGAVLGLRAVTLVLIGALYSLAVDPDEVLTMLRRVSFGSALTATVATRMVPVLVRDSRRLADAQRCRPGRPPGRLQLLHATTAGVLDRALDMAAALEVRGYSVANSGPGLEEAGRRTGGWPGRGRLQWRRHWRPTRPWSRHDLAFTAAAVALLALTITSAAAGAAPFVAYPRLSCPLGLAVVAVAAATATTALAPLAATRGIER